MKIVRKSKRNSKETQIFCREFGLSSIILTGGIAHSDRIVGWICEKIRFLGEVFVVPGDAEMEALYA